MKIRFTKKFSKITASIFKQGLKKKMLFFLVIFGKVYFTLPMYLWEYVDDLTALSKKTLI